MQEQDDSLGIFADVITGALGIVMFVALFFALRALSSSTGLTGIEVKPGLRSELVRQQLEAARVRASQRPPAGSGFLATAAGHSSEGGEAAPEDPIAAARRRDFARQQVRLIELEVLETAADNLREEYVARREQAIEAFVANCGAPLRIPSGVVRPSARSWYVFVKGDRAHPLHTVRDAVLQRDTEHVGWVLYDNNRQMRAFPQAGRGWSAAEATPAIRARAEAAASLGWDLVLLVAPDSFASARGLLRELADAGVTVSWRPAPAADYVSLSADAAGAP
jgi:hypothetical protein